MFHQTNTLTTGEDSGPAFTGGAGSDTFSAPAAALSLNGNLVQTLNSVDQLDGGAGNDTLTATLLTGTVTPILRNIETVVVRSIDAASTLDLASSTGTTKLVNANSTANMTFDNVQNLALIEISGVATAAATTTVNFDADVTEDSADSVALSFVGNTSAGAVAIGAGFETVNVTASGKNTIASLATGAKTITITGAGDLKITGTVAAATKIDGTSATGKLELTSDVAKVNITTGSGADKVTVNAIDKDVKVALGEGTDTLVVGAAGNKDASFDGGAGRDTLNILDGAHVGDRDVGKSFKNFEVLSVTGGTGDYDLDHLRDNNTIDQVTAGALAADVTVTNLASGSTVALNVSNGHDLAVSAKAGLPGATNVLSVNVAGDAGVAADALTITNTQTLNILSSTTATESASTVVNSIATLNTASSTINLSGANQLTITSFGNSTSVTKIDASEMTGKFIMGDADQSASATLIIGGSAADTIIANGAAGTIVQGGGGADTITLGDAAQTVKFVAQSDSTGSAFDKVTGFTVGTDKIDVSFLGFTGTAATVATTAKATLAGTGAATTFTIAANDAATFFTNAGVQSGVVFQKADTDTFVFIDANGDGKFDAAADMAILLVANTTDPLAADFTFVA